MVNENFQEVCGTMLKKTKLKKRETNPRPTNASVINERRLCFDPTQISHRTFSPGFRVICCQGQTAAVFRMLIYGSALSSNLNIMAPDVWMYWPEYIAASVVCAGPYLSHKYGMCEWSVLFALSR
ncbi:hypothetical protein J6590_043612 [Homalodisca vitripennis]|nr:hypothetical protein J6590_043612 [Homalodisca vitripennis]